MKLGDLSLHLEAYLALKKALGLALGSALGFPLGARERLLRDFVAFADSSGVRGTIKPKSPLIGLVRYPRDQWKSGAFERCETISLSSQRCRPRH